MDTKMLIARWCAWTQSVQRPHRLKTRLCAGAAVLALVAGCTALPASTASTAAATTTASGTVSAAGVAVDAIITDLQSIAAGTTDATVKAAIQTNAIDPLQALVNQLAAPAATTAVSNVVGTVNTILSSIVAIVPDVAPLLALLADAGPQHFGAPIVLVGDVTPPAAPHQVHLTAAQKAAIAAHLAQLKAAVQAHPAPAKQ